MVFIALVLYIMISPVYNYLVHATLDCCPLLHQTMYGDLLVIVLLVEKESLPSAIESSISSFR